MHVLAPAKINLHLRVGPRRDDGFHPLVSWMCTVGLFDSLSFERSEGHAVPREFSLRCNKADIPCGAENLVCKAAAAIGAKGSEPLGVECFLRKSIPSGAGLGGGSADAARTLVALNKLCNLSLPFAELTSLSAKIGSDVAFFLHEPSAICRGRGERVEKIAKPNVGWALLILPAIHCPTPRIYQQFDEMGLGEEECLKDAVWHQWATLNAHDLLPLLINDLEKPAFALFPKLAEIRGRAEQLLAQPVRMSGSGSSLFTLFDSQAECELARASLARIVDAEILSVPLCPALEDDLASH
jgi:4-diphosphocytidyl-2-C-methyl-D-erythritol kinase